MSVRFVPVGWNRSKLIYDAVLLAALCFVGDVPLIFVAAEAVAGSAYMVLADADGGTPPETARALIGVPVALEGSLERRGTLLIFRVDFDRARLL